MRWLEEGPDGERLEYRDICPLNEAGPPLDRIAEDDCWTIGPVEGHLATLQRRATAADLRRIPLRSLFRK